MKKKLLMNKDGKVFLVKTYAKDLHTQFGFFKSRDLKKGYGQKIFSNMKSEFTIIKPRFIDLFKRIRRNAQIIPLKDVGVILALTGINKNSIVVDAGSGSGALACFLANIAKKVISYEIRKDFAEIVKENIKFLNIKNLIVKEKNVYDGIDERNIDLVTLDVPEPWKALKACEACLKTGGFLASYSPTIPQVMDFVREIKSNKTFIYLRTIEIIERDWEVDKRKVRPKNQAIGHSGFISFARKI